MDKINFTGYTNLSTLSLMTECEKKVPTQVHRFMMKVNDVGIKDLSKLEDALGDKPLLKGNYLQLDIYEPHCAEDTEEIAILSASKLFVNGKELKKEPESIPLLKKLSRLTGRISKDNENGLLASDIFENNAIIEDHYKKNYKVPMQFGDNFSFESLNDPEQLKASSNYFSLAYDAFGTFIKSLWN